MSMYRRLLPGVCGFPVSWDASPDVCSAGGWGWGAGEGEGGALLAESCPSHVLELLGFSIAVEDKFRNAHLSQ